MTIATSELPLTVTVRDRASMESQLDAAVSRVRSAVGHDRPSGILVTRRGSDEVTVELSDTVPFGMIHERQDW